MIINGWFVIKSQLYKLKELISATTTPLHYANAAINVL